MSVFLNAGSKRFAGLYGWVFGFYLGIGPVYWLPGVRPEYIDILKLCAFLICVVGPILSLFQYKTLRFPGGPRILALFLCLFTFSIPGLLLGKPEEVQYRIQNMIQIPLFVWACGYLMLTNRIVKIAKIALSVFVIFSAASLFLMLTKPTIISPLNNLLFIKDTGFGGSRTSWGPAIALYLPWFFILSSVALKVSILVIICLMLNQFLIAGRTGMLSSLSSYLLWMFLSKKFRIFAISMIGGLAILFYIITNLESLRLARGGFSSFHDLNDLSTGRMEQYVVALKLIYKNFLFGTGFGNAYLEGQYWHIHNAILRFSAESGIFLGLTIITIFSVALIRGFPYANLKSPVFFSAFLTVVSGIVASMFEPGFMFGSFNNSVFWWFCFALCVTKEKTSLMNKA